MKFAFHSIAWAALTASVSGFISPSSVPPMTGGVLVDENTVCTPPQSSSSLKAVDGDEDLDVFVGDMIKMSDFVYDLREIRNIVRTKEGKKVWQDGERKEIEFFEKALVVTDIGSQERDDNKQLKYVITLPAILRFLENNRRWFKEVPAPGGFIDIEFDNTDKTKPFKLEEQLKVEMEDNIKIVDYDDKYSTDKGGLVYAVVVNLTRKWITVVFRGTIGVADWWTNFDYRLNHDSFFGEEGDITAGGNPGTHNGFTGYLVSERTSDSVERPYIDRILACVNGEFKDNPDVAGKGFKFFVTGHSLGGGMANLFAFRAAQLKSKDDESVKYLPETIKAMTVAAPCVGNFDYNDEFQALEKKGFLRHLRISSEFDVVPTNTLPPVPIIFRGGNTKVYTQNGLNLFLQEGKKMVVNYRNTKSFWSQVLFNVFKVIDSHSPGVHYSRLNTIPGNQEVLEQTLEEIYKEAGDFTD